MHVSKIYMDIYLMEYNIMDGSFLFSQLAASYACMHGLAFLKFQRTTCTLTKQTETVCQFVYAWIINIRLDQMLVLRPSAYLAKLKIGRQNISLSPCHPMQCIERDKYVAPTAIIYTHVGQGLAGATYILTIIFSSRSHYYNIIYTSPLQLQPY